MKVRKEKQFFSVFDEKTGNYMRSGIIKNGKETKQDPFMSSFPELLDVGIMGHCIHGSSGLCVKAGIGCYQDGLHRNDDNMTLQDFEEIVRQCKGNTYQFALGGCGDPDQHGDFEAMLKMCYEAGIVPNFTTSGLGLNEEIVALCKQYCGAVAVSWYRSEYTVRAINMLVSAGVKTNIHYVISKATVQEAIERLKTESFPKGINAIVFLLHKPIGLGTEAQMIRKDNVVFQQLLAYINSGKSKYKIGFDSCTVPAIITNPGVVDMDCLDTCEGARWSAYITADMKMLPCSFDNQDLHWSVDLRKHSIVEAWNSDVFESFRSHFRKACPSCENRNVCMGGCPIRPDIVLCDSEKKNIMSY